MTATSQPSIPAPFTEVGSRAHFNKTNAPPIQEEDDLVDADEKSFQDVFIKRKKQ